MLLSRCIHHFLCPLLRLRNFFFCVNPFFFSSLFRNCVQLILLFSVESKLLSKVSKYGVIHLGNLLKRSIINEPHLRDVLLAKGFLFWKKHLVQVDFVLHIYRCFLLKFSYNSMDFKYLSENNIMVYVLPYALVLHDFSSKEIQENSWQVKGSALHEVIQDELVTLARSPLIFACE